RRIDGDAGDQVGPRASAVAVRKIVGAARDRDCQHPPRPHRPDAARLPAAEDLRGRARGQEGLAGTEGELVDPVAGYRVADVLGAIAAIAGAARDVLDLHRFAAADRV